MKKLLLSVGIITVTLALIAGYSFSQPADVKNPDASAYGRESVKRSTERSARAEAASQEMLLSGPVTLYPESESEPGVGSGPKSELEPVPASELKPELEPAPGSGPQKE